MPSIKFKITEDKAEINVLVQQINHLKQKPKNNEARITELENRIQILVSNQIESEEKWRAQWEQHFPPGQD